MHGHITSRCPSDLLSIAGRHNAIRTAIVNCSSLQTMNSAYLACQQGLLEPVLIGDKCSIERHAKTLAWDISAIRQVPSDSDSAAARIAVSLARSSEVSGLMKGDIATDVLLRAVIDKHNGILCGSRLSHVFHLSVPEQASAVCVTDAVINVLPGLAEKLAIARNAVSLLHALEIALPRVAVLSGTEKANSSMPSSIEAEQLAKLAAQGEIKGALLDGPVAMDIAVSANAAALKGYKSDVSGQADVLLVPSVEAGNILFKAMVHYLGATAAGLVLGATAPIMLTSRSDPPEARVASAALASIYCAANAAH